MRSIQKNFFSLPLTLGCSCRFVRSTPTSPHCFFKASSTNFTTNQTYASTGFTKFLNTKISSEPLQNNASHNSTFLPLNCHNLHLSIKSLKQNLSLNNSTFKFANTPPSILINKRFNSNSFIKSVLEQAKKDIEKQPELKKAMENMKLSAQQNRSTSQRIKTQTLKNYEVLSIKIKGLAQNFMEFNSTAFKTFQTLLEKFSWLQEFKNNLTGIYSKLLPTITFFSSKIERFSSYLKEEPEAEKKAAEWRRQQAIKRYEEENMNKEKDTTEATENSTFHEKSNFEANETALVIIKSSAWDHFGTRLKDMPFLQSFYENPFFGKIFGETEIAASIREMKLVDNSFRFPEFMETVQQIVAPHLVDCFLHGDKESLRLHCGDSAFFAALSSIKERDTMKVTLDTTILRFYGVELIGAKRVDDDTPWFIFSFSTQQINCLRDLKGTIVSGAIDDIRDVAYSIALTKHPKPDTAGLHHPWMIKEFAILQSSPSW